MGAVLSLWSTFFASACSSALASASACSLALASPCLFASAFALALALAFALALDFAALLLELPVSAQAGAGPKVPRPKLRARPKVLHVGRRRERGDEVAGIPWLLGAKLGHGQGRVGTAIRVRAGRVRAIWRILGGSSFPRTDSRKKAPKAWVSRACRVWIRLATGPSNAHIQDVVSAIFRRQRLPWTLRARRFGAFGRFGPWC